MATIYCWGNGKKVADFDPESVAVALFVEKYCDADSEIEIRPTSEYTASYNGHLPFMVVGDGDAQIHGFKAIVRSLAEQDKLETPLKKDSATRLVDDGFVEYLLDHFTAITDYNLFLNRDNYTGTVRPMFKQLAPFPFQYKPPIDFRTEAMRVCEGYGITADDALDDEDSEEMEKIKAQERELKERPIMTDLQQTEIEKVMEKLAIRKGLLTNMKCVRLMSDILTQSKELDYESLPLSEVLLRAFVIANTIPQLKSTFVRDYMKQNFPKLLQEADASRPTEESAATTSDAGLSLLTALKDSITSYI